VVDCVVGMVVAVAGLLVLREALNISPMVPFYLPSGSKIWVIRPASFSGGRCGGDYQIFYRAKFLWLDGGNVTLPWG